MTSEEIGNATRAQNKVIRDIARYEDAAREAEARAAELRWIAFQGTPELREMLGHLKPGEWLHDYSGMLRLGADGSIERAEFAYPNDLAQRIAEWNAGSAGAAGLAADMAAIDAALPIGFVERSLKGAASRMEVIAAHAFEHVEGCQAVG